MILTALALGSLGLGAGALGTGLWSAHQNRKSQKSLNKTLIQLANTAHQREVKDLRAAGLNPILSAQGSGASVPNLTAPQYSEGDVVAQASENFNSVLGNIAGIQQAEASTANIKADTAIKQADAEKAKILKDYYKTQAGADDVRTQFHNDALSKGKEAVKYLSALGISPSSAREVKGSIFSGAKKYWTGLQSGINANNAHDKAVKDKREKLNNSQMWRRHKEVMDDYKKSLYNWR